MTFNVAKCKVMHASRKRSPLSPTTPITLNGSILKVVTTYKYLGLHISSDLSWSYHIQSICSKARNILGLLYRKYYIQVLWSSYPAPIVHIISMSSLGIRCSSVGSLPSTWYPATRKNRSLLGGCAPRPGMQATHMSFYMLYSFLLYPITGCSSGYALYSKSFMDCVTFLLM